ncbi:endonuclease [Xanthomarina sp. F2636L]|uniref:endonuclease n=1 Tax=Xanthomarina sp. F2636L TaxID=2996018 RepID=UPI00225E3CB1|nr:endonuclease [Xanthomarina sp. F2636L]MCX7550162.1 endonuclease [Xanthomarina sp. F2636L]
MKHFYTILLLLVSTFAFAQIPAGYYDSATGTGYTLKTQLSNIITTGHSPKTYDQLFSLATGYRATDIDDFYENDGSVMDMYSENPIDSDPYNYDYYASPSEKCGSYNSENDCYNGEHLMPQSVYSSDMPMVGDIHQVIPSDGYVNNGRGSLAFGETNSASTTYMNGSKRGSSSVSGYSGTVFEPIDEFKGDIARCLLYFAVRYEDQVASWNHAMLNNTSDQVYEDWFIDLLLDWHNNDAVNQREINRNNASYIHQGNRNPFIDNPGYANLIWNPTPDTEVPSNPTNLVASNPSGFTIDLAWTASTDNIAVTSYDIYVDGTNSFNSSNTTFTVPGLAPETNYCFTIKAKDAAGNESGFSNQACETTTSNGTGVNCLAETFENIPANSGSYSVRTWTGDAGGAWIASDARTDLTLNNRAITIRNGSLTAPTASGGIGSFTVTTKRVYGGSSGTFNLKVNGNIVGTIAYGDQDVVQTTTIPNINVEGNVSVVIDENSSTTNRVVFDDLSWTCYTDLNVLDYQLNGISIYPNPIQNVLNIQMKHSNTTQIEIFNILGKRVFTKTIQQSQSVQLDNLSSGMYILKLTQGNSIISRKLIKN